MVRVASLQVRGSLSSADVAPGISRAAPALSACYKRAARGTSTSPTVNVRVSLSFDDSRRASNVHATSTWSALTACVASVAESLRIPIVPDVGTVDVIVDFAFQPTGP